MCAHDANMQILDDGGVHGYSTLLILDEIMEAIIRREKSYPDSPAESSYHPLVPPTAKLWLPCHYFDYIGGIGSGGLIAVMLGRLKMDISNTILASQAFLTEVFKTKRWLPVRAFWFWPREKYDHLILEQKIRKIVSQFAPRISGFPGNSEFAFDENQCRTVVLVARQGKYRSSPYTPYIHRTYSTFRLNGHNGDFGLAHQGPIWQVARATTALPSFFQPTIIDGLKYSSGTLLETDTSFMMHEEVRKANGGTNHSIILSIGGGASSRQNLESEKVRREMLEVPGYIRLNADNGLDQMEVDEWRARGRLRTNIGSLIGRYSVAPKNRSTPAIVKHDSNIPKWFQPKNLTTESIRKRTREYLDREDVQSKISEIADLLVEKRRDRVRCDPGRWEKFCFQTWYRCVIPGCPRAGKEYGSREALQWHLVDKHGDKFSEEAPRRLEAALDQGQIRVR